MLSLYFSYLFISICHRLFLLILTFSLINSLHLTNDRRTITYLRQTPFLNHLIFLISIQSTLNLFPYFISFLFIVNSWNFINWSTHLLFSVVWLHIPYLFLRFKHINRLPLKIYFLRTLSRWRNSAELFLLYRYGWVSFTHYFSFV